MNGLLQILAAAAGSLGFGMLFRLRPKRLIWALLGGGLTWSVYLLCEKCGMNDFSGNLAATVFAAVWAEILAHRRKAPAQIFLITAIVPLIPGSLLYRTMQALVARDPSAAELGTRTALTAAALAFGTMLVAALMHVITEVKKKR